VAFDKAQLMIKTVKIPSFQNGTSDNRVSLKGAIKILPFAMHRKPTIVR